MIGVVGPGREAFADDVAGSAPVRTGSAESVIDADPDAVVALGEAATIALARVGAGVPTLPVEAGPGLGSVTRDAALDAVDAVFSGEYATRSAPVLDVHLGEERVGRALFDVTLVTSEPARISEYGVETDRVADRFRADGVVVATPAGSHGYANAAGGPILDPGSDALAVVPVAAFEIRSDVWVVSPPVALSVERGEDGVSLLVDDETRPETPHDGPVRVSVGGELPLVALP